MPQARTAITGMLLQICPDRSSNPVALRGETIAKKFEN
jgi:hypothetical protein